MARRDNTSAIAITILRRNQLSDLGTSIVLWEGLLFRDYLCQHPDEAASYAKLKCDLAQRFSSDREAYTAEKAEYIESVMQKARRLDK
ncbi:MAG TPA: hypothetical protein DCY88_12180 [Cyanobacteria bacterium UBA11372]|nr:hypothetical protein [Cyanobacteria bacterium UBA11372]